MTCSSQNSNSSSVQKDQSVDTSMSIKLDQLKHGDMVLAFDNVGNVKFERVLLLFHAGRESRSSNVDGLQLHFGDKENDEESTLVLTPSHMLYVNECCKLNDLKPARFYFIFLRVRIFSFSPFLFTTH